MLRFSVDPGPARANVSAVYALFGVVLIPVSFLAIRLANDFIHPVVFNSAGPQMADSMFFTFCVVAGGDARARVRALPARAHGQAAGRDDEAAAGGPGVSSGEKYVAAAYLVVFVAVLVYLVIMQLKLQRLQRELAELAELAQQRGASAEHEPARREAAEVG